SPDRVPGLRPSDSTGNRVDAARASGAAVAPLALVAQHELAAPAVELEELRRLDQVDELAVAVVARVERGLVADLLAHRAERGPAILAGGVVYGIVQQRSKDSTAP